MRKLSPLEVHIIDYSNIYDDVEELTNAILELTDKKVVTESLLDALIGRVEDAGQTLADIRSLGFEGTTQEIVCQAYKITDFEERE